MTTARPIINSDGANAVVFDQDGRVLSQPVSKSVRGQPDQQGNLGFADAGFAVGDALQVVSLDAPEQTQRVMRLTGWRAPLSLLLEDLDAEGNASGFKAGERLQVRFFSRQHAIQFDTLVLRVCRTPYAYLHLAYPTQITRSAKRAAPRVSTELIVSVSRLDSKRRFLAGGQSANVAGRLLDLSPDGALIQTKEPLGSRGTRIAVRLRVKRSALDAILTLNGHIRSVRRAARERTEAVLHGVQFEAMDIRDRLILQSMMYEELLLAQGGRVPPLLSPAR